MHLSPCFVTIIILETSKVLTPSWLTSRVLHPSVRSCKMHLLLIKRITDMVRHHGKQWGDEHCPLYYKQELENTPIPALKLKMVSAPLLWSEQRTSLAQRLNTRPFYPVPVTEFPDTGKVLWGITPPPHSGPVVWEGSQLQGKVQTGLRQWLHCISWVWYLVQG